MFEFVRKHNKILMIVLMLLIIPSFGVVGLNTYRSLEHAEGVASVDGHEITQQEWDAAHQRYADQVRQQNPQIDPKLLDTPQEKYRTLEMLVRERVTLAAAQKDHLSPSEGKVLGMLQAEVASVGDKAQYQAILAAQGLTAEGRVQQIGSQLASQQVLGGVSGTGFASQSQSDTVLNAYLEKREIQVAQFKAADFTKSVTVSDADLEAYYKDHQALFRLPEQASIEYLVLDMDAVKKTVDVSEQDLRTYYEQNKQILAGKEERRASHILIPVAKDAKDADRQKAKARAEELLAQVKKNPSQFADLAKKNSADTASAVNGGDLGFFGRGLMVKPFEDLVYAQKKGDIGLVESEFGYHVIQLTDIKEAKVPSFEEARAKMEDEVRTQLAQKKFAESAETFTNTVYEQSDSLKPAADKLKLTIKAASGLTRAPAPGATGPLASQRLLEAVFAPDATEKKRNTEAVETGPSQLTSARIVQYTAARVPPFTEVRAKVQGALVAQRAAELARKAGEAKLEAWRKDPASATGMPAAQLVSRDLQPTPPVAPAAMDAAMHAPVATLPAFIGTASGDDYLVVRVNKLIPRTPDTAKAQQERAMVTQAASAAEALAYYQTLKERLKVKIKVPRPAATEAG